MFDFYLLQEYPEVLMGYIFVFGLCIGSFLNVVVLRAFSNESISYPASKCPVCQKPLFWWHNIPLLSYQGIIFSLTNITFLNESFILFNEFKKQRNGNIINTGKSYKKKFNLPRRDVPLLFQEAKSEK
mgnify:CR=1 FL=1